VTKPPETVHTLFVSLEKLVASPDVAVALKAKGVVENARGSSEPKSIVWLTFNVVKVTFAPYDVPWLFVAYERAK
jgi:hypothetical protein